MCNYICKLVTDCVFRVRQSEFNGLFSAFSLCSWAITLWGWIKKAEMLNKAQEDCIFFYIIKIRLVHRLLWRKPVLSCKNTVPAYIVPFIIALSWSSGDLHFCFRVSRSPNRLSNMAFAIGSIMAVVAVLLSHMERNDEVVIIPKMSLWG